MASPWWKSDTSLFIYKDRDDVAYLLIDDIVPTTSSIALMRCITGHLSSEFAMTDFGTLHFLDISVTCSADGLLLSRRQYAIDLLQWAGMAECHRTTTPVDSRSKLSATEGVADPSE